MRTDWIWKLSVFAIASLLAVSALQLRGMSVDAYDKITTPDDRYYLPPAPWLNAFSLGYGEAGADILWATTLVYFGGKKHWIGSSKSGSKDSSPINTVKYLNLVTSLDPKFRGAYRDGGRLTLYHQGEITRQAVEMSIELLEKGTHNFPNDGDIAFNLGFLHYYEMEPFLPEEKDDPLRRKHKEEGTHILRRAAGMDDAPPYASILASTLMNREGMDDLVVAHLQAMLVKETNPDVRRTLESQLYRSLGEAALRDIEATKTLQERWRRDYPHVPFDLFLLVQPGYEIDHREVLEPELYADRILGIAPEQ